VIGALKYEVIFKWALKLHIRLNDNAVPTGLFSLKKIGVSKLYQIFRRCDIFIICCCHAYADRYIDLMILTIYRFSIKKKPDPFSSNFNKAGFKIPNNNGKFVSAISAENILISQIISDFFNNLF